MLPSLRGLQALSLLSQTGSLTAANLHHPRPFSFSGLVAMVDGIPARRQA